MPCLFICLICLHVIFYEFLGLRIKIDLSEIGSLSSPQIDKRYNIYYSAYQWGPRNFHFWTKDQLSFSSKVVFDQLRINQYSFDWYVVIDKKDLSCIFILLKKNRTLELENSNQVEKEFVDLFGDRIPVRARGGLVN